MDGNCNQLLLHLSNWIDLASTKIVRPIFFVLDLGACFVEMDYQDKQSKKNEGKWNSIYYICRTCATLLLTLQVISWNDVGIGFWKQIQLESNNAAFAKPK
jgi:hypothetical protein